MKHKIYKDAQGNTFEVTFVDHTTSGSWVHYRNTKTNQEYNCLIDAFKQRFTVIENTK